MSCSYDLIQSCRGVHNWTCIKKRSKQAGQGDVRVDLPFGQVLQYATKFVGNVASGGSVRLTEIDSSPEVLRRLVELVAEHNLAQLEIEDGALRISVKGAVAPVAATQVAHSFVQTGMPQLAAAPAPAPAVAAVDKRAG